MLSVNKKHGNLYIMCRPGRVFNRVGYYYEVSVRKKIRGRFINLAEAAHGHNHNLAVKVDGGLADRIKVIGMIDNEKTKQCFVAVVIEDISVKDSGEYKCSVNAVLGPKKYMFESDAANITLHGK